ncbi:fumarylacetoacetate (FAA) hydrolase [Brevibacterium sp. XM4083]|uniref:fumarylacetoacetate (FAA) hydrolase n=1 Tax=Brevibacterium sp. XM4083 TaxID=2583238 RepID=UPI00112D1627|nr:fumarylacetoacetate (FAA) hydrolase [Brevibacterium sp. XM4083]MCM1011819.1 hypothetical protein [Brevibacterium sp. XM4083]
MTITVFECVNQGERHIGVSDSTSTLLYKAPDFDLGKATIAHGSLELAIDALKHATDPVEPAGPATVDRLIPALPRDGRESLVSGFMRTHRSKFEDSEPEGSGFPPNWFFKGFGSWLKLDGENLVVPQRAVALIEEPELVVVYINDDEGTPHYVGYTFGNDLCDIGLHRQNPGWNPYCKLCDTAILDGIRTGRPPAHAEGTTRISRDSQPVWEGTFDCGEDALQFPVDAMVSHLFTFPAMHRPGMVNYIYLGADLASFHDGFRIADKDTISISIPEHGVNLTNTIHSVETSL